MFQNLLMSSTAIVIRPSALPSWNDCPRRQAAKMFRRQILAAGYDLRETPRNIGATIGTANHKAAHLLIKGVIDTGQPATLSDAIEPALAEMKESLAQGVAWDEISFSRDSAERQVRRMTGAYLTQTIPHLRPIATEQRLEADLGGGFVLSGQKDVLCVEPRRIRDLKGGKVQRVNVLQYGAYSLLERSHQPEPIVELVEDFLQRVSLNKSQPDVKQVIYPAAPAEHQAAVALTEIERAYKRFERRIDEQGDFPAEDAFPANPMSMLCGPKWCPAHGTNFCRLHMGAK